MNFDQGAIRHLHRRDLVPPGGEAVQLLDYVHTSLRLEWSDRLLRGFDKVPIRFGSDRRFLLQRRLMDRRMIRQRKPGYQPNYQEGTHSAD